MIQAEKTVIRSTTGMTRVTTMAGLIPSASSTSTVTAPVATNSLKISSLTLSLAVAP